MRAEQSGNLDGNESNVILRIEYSGKLDNDSAHFQEGDRLPNTQNEERLYTNAPLVINEYKITVASNDLVMVHQWFGDLEDVNEISVWNTTYESFHHGLKNWTMVPGSKDYRNTRWQDGSVLDGEIDVLGTAHSNEYAVRSLTFKKRKGSKSPIVLSKNRGGCFGFTVSNISGNEDAFYYAVVEIKDWATLR